MCMQSSAIYCISVEVNTLLQFIGKMFKFTREKNTIFLVPFLLNQYLNCFLSKLWCVKLSKWDKQVYVMSVYVYMVFFCSSLFKLVCIGEINIYHSSIAKTYRHQSISLSFFPSPTQTYMLIKSNQIKSNAQVKSIHSGLWFHFNTQSTLHLPSKRNTQNEIISNTTIFRFTLNSKPHSHVNQYMFLFFWWEKKMYTYRIKTVVYKLCFSWNVETDSTNQT